MGGWRSGCKIYCHNNKQTPKKSLREYLNSHRIRMKEKVYIKATWPIIHRAQHCCCTTKSFTHINVLCVPYFANCIRKHSKQLYYTPSEAKWFYKQFVCVYAVADSAMVGCVPYDRGRVLCVCESVNTFLWNDETFRGVTPNSPSDALPSVAVCYCSELHPFNDAMSVILCRIVVSSN